MSVEKSALTETLSPSTESAEGRRTEPKVALIVHCRGGAGFVVLERDAPVTIGRAPAFGLSLDEPTLSREHARFTLAGGRVLVEDLGSKNGTFIAGRRVDRATVEIGDDIAIGAAHIRVQALSAKGDSLRIEGEESLRRHVEEEISRSIEFRRPFALLFARVVGVGGGAPRSMSARPLLEVVRQRLRSVDRIALYADDALQILLPETGLEAATRIARDLAAPPPADGVSFFVGVAEHRRATERVDELIERSRTAAQKASIQSPVAIAPDESWGVAGEIVVGSGDVVAGARMREILDIVSRVALSRLPVILLGRTGTGKEVLARLLHEQGPRKARRMVRVNCGAIPKDLVESTLFGHERGAFTGAVQQQRGVFEEANEGTVFLDEIGELPLSAQAALLRVLETGCFSRVGSTKEISVDVRVVAATHRDLDAMVAAGTFRDDLFYRLGGVTIEIPALAERTDDIEPLAHRFLRMANESNGRSAQGITPEAMDLLKSYAWPGNVRELKNTIERAVVIARGARVTPEDLPVRVREARAQVDRPSESVRSSEGAPSSSGRARDPGAALPLTPGAGEATPVRGKVQDYEAKIIVDALDASGWNRGEAATRLGIPLRTLSYRMKVLGIRKPPRGKEVGR